jgi:hypothetical protein
VATASTLSRWGRFCAPGALLDGAHAGLVGRLDAIEAVLESARAERHEERGEPVSESETFTPGRFIAAAGWQAAARPFRDAQHQYTIREKRTAGIEPPPAAGHDAFIRQIEEHGYRDVRGPQLHLPRRRRLHVLDEPRDLPAASDHQPKEEPVNALPPFGSEGGDHRQEVAGEAQRGRIERRPSRLDFVSLGVEDSGSLGGTLRPGAIRRR